MAAENDALACELRCGAEEERREREAQVRDHVFLIPAERERIDLLERKVLERRQLGAGIEVDLADVAVSFRDEGVEALDDEVVLR